MKVELEEILKDLKTICFCPHCGAVMDYYTHYCEECKERVSTPDDGEFFVEYFNKKYKSGVKGK